MLANITAFSLGSGATRADTGEDFDSDKVILNSRRITAAARHMKLLHDATKQSLFSALANCNEDLLLPCCAKLGLIRINWLPTRDRLILNLC